MSAKDIHANGIHGRAYCGRRVPTKQITFTPDTITCADCAAALIADQTNH